MQTLHHIRTRKKIIRKYKFLDTFVYVGAAIGPVITIPQILLIWNERNAAGISSLTWLGYACGSAIWIAYGLAHKEKPIFLTNMAMISVQITVLIGSLIY